MAERHFPPAVLAAALVYVIAVVALSAVAQPAQAEPQGSIPEPIVHIPFDGFLANIGSFATRPRMVGSSGDLAEQEPDLECAARGRG